MASNAAVVTFDGGVGLPVYGGGAGGEGLELGGLWLGRVQAREQQMRMMEMAHQQQQQQQWAASMEAAWSATSAAVSSTIGGGTPPAWAMPVGRGGDAPAVAHWQRTLPVSDVIGAAVASASENIVRLLRHEQMPATSAHGSVELPPPLQQLPQHVKAAFFRRATMLARHAGQ
jgi:hypothetical protein